MAASYPAVIDLRVNNLAALKELESGTKRVTNLFNQIKQQRNLFDQSVGKAATREVTRNLSKLMEGFAGAKESARQFQVTLEKTTKEGTVESTKNVNMYSKTLAGLGSQLRTVDQILANSTVAQKEFNNALVVANKLSTELTRNQLKAAAAGAKAGAGGVKGLLALGQQLPNTVKALELYQLELQDTLRIVNIGSKEYRELALAIAAVNKQLAIAEGRGNIQGPKLPPGFNERGRIESRGGGKKQGPGALQTAGQFGLGTGFPLLFGGGAGQVIGGGVGTALAGAFGATGQAAMGLQIGLSAIIGKAEELITRFRAVGNAINSLSMDALADSFITVNAETRTLVRRLVEAGDAQSAVSVAANEVYKQTRLTPDSVSDITNNLNVLSNVWDEVVATVAGLVSLVTKDFITGLSVVLKIVSQIAKGMNVVLQKAQEISKTEFFKTILGTVPGVGPALLAYKEITEQVQKNTKGISEEEEKSLAIATSKADKLQTEFIRSKELYNLERTRTKGKTAAEQLINAKIKKSSDLKKLEFETEDKILAIRTEHAGVEDSVLQKMIGAEKALAKIKELRINDAFVIKQQNIDLTAQRELDKQAKENLKVRIEQHKIAQGAIKAQTTLLAGQVQIFNLQAQAAQSVFAVTQARNKSELSALKLEESRLQRQLANLQRIDKFYGKQREIINKIANNRKKQAQIEFKVEQQSIKQMVAKAQVQRQLVKFEVQKIDLQILLLRLQAEEIRDTQKKLERLAEINQQSKISAEIAKQMTISADKSLASAKEIAKFQKLSAQHLLDGKLESIEAERVDARRAVHAASIAKSAKAAASATSSGSSAGSSLGERVSNSIRSATTLGPAGRSTGTVSTSGPIDPEVYNKVMSMRPSGGYAHPGQLMEALDKEQAAFDTNNLIRARRASAIPGYAEGGYTGSINIQTGPVMQQDNETYLTMGQFEEGMRELTESLSRGGRSYGSRQFQGVS